MSESGAPTVSFPLKERAMDEAPVGITITDASQSDNPLIYVNEAFERITGYPREEVLGRNCRLLQGPDTREAPVRQLREAVDAGEPTTVELRNYRRDGEPFWNEVTIAPIGEGEPTNFVGFQNDVTRRKTAEMALETERARLDDVFQRVERLLDAVTTAIIAPTSRRDLECAVCEGLVEAGPYEAAWIGAVDATGERIEPSATAGDHPALPEGAVAFDADHPTAAALRDRVLTGLPDPVDGTDDHVADGDGRTIAIPLHHGESEYGVITVVAPASIRIDERESTVLTALGRAIATALSAVETRRILVADEVIDVELSVRDGGLFFVRITDRVDCRLTYEGAVADADAPSLFFTASGASIEAIIEAAETCPDVDAVTTVIGDEDRHLVEFELERDPLVGRLAAFGAETRSIVAEDGAASIQFTLPAGADLRSLVERVREQYPSTELVSTTNRERPPETKQEFFSRVETELTDRQLAALQTAFVGGYFDRPRRATGDELAESMDLTRSTFHQHLRVAQRKLLAEFFKR